MAGILAQAQQAQQAPQAPAAEPSPEMTTDGMPQAPADQAAEGGDEDLGLPNRDPADPEEQEAFDRAKALGLKLMSQKGALDRLINTIRSQGLSGVAEMISMLVARIDEQMDLPETVILPVATELAGFVFDAAERARLKVSPEDAQKCLGMVYQSLAQVYGQSPADAKEAIDEVEAGNGNPARSA